MGAGSDERRPAACDDRCVHSVPRWPEVKRPPPSRRRARTPPYQVESGPVDAPRSTILTPQGQRRSKGTGAPVKAVEFNVTIPGFILAKTLGRFSDAFVYGRASRLGLVERPRPELPGDDWVRVEVLLCGICGSDLGNVSYKSSPAMEPFGSFPAILGHEILGRVAEVGPGVVHVAPGDRVVIDPMLHCEVRGWEEKAWCPSCVAGLHSTCELSGEEGAPAGGRPSHAGRWRAPGCGAGTGCCTGRWPTAGTRPDDRLPPRPRGRLGRGDDRPPTAGLHGPR